MTEWREKKTMERNGKKRKEGIIGRDKTSKEIIIIRTQTITLFILMKSSYPTYHSNKIEE